MVRALDVVHLGAASRDLTDDDPRGWRLGGGVTYAALTTARLGLATAAAIGLDELAATAWELEMLRDAGVEVRPIRLPEGPVFVNQERPTGRVQVAHSVGVRLPDEPLPEPFASDALTPLAVAFVLRRTGAGPRISLTRRAVGATPPHHLAPPLAKNPIAPALALFDALAGDRPACVAVEWGDGPVWCVEVAP